MMNLIPHHRLHISNGLAMLAALLLLISSVAGNESNQEVYSSGQESIPSVKVESAKNKSTNDAVKDKSRSLKLGLLLFRRG